VTLPCLTVVPVCCEYCCLLVLYCFRTLLPAYPEALVVEDAVLDARFKENPLVSFQALVAVISSHTTFETTSITQRRRLSCSRAQDGQCN